MPKARNVVIVGSDLLAAGITSIVRAECGSVITRTLSRCEDAALLATEGSEVSLTVLEVRSIDKVKAKADVEALRKQFPAAGLIIATKRGNRSEVIEHLAAGAHGVIFRDQSLKEIACALKLVMDGGIYTPSFACGAEIELPSSDLAPRRAEPIKFAQITTQVTAQVAAQVTAPSARSIVVDALSLPEGTRLSQRQAAVLQLLARGLSNKAIARELGLSEATVKVHNNALFKALKVTNRASAVARVLSDQWRERGDRKLGNSGQMV
jgi:DNA-binding NarL/FixJ family response regulator